VLFRLTQYVVSNQKKNEHAAVYTAALVQVRTKVQVRIPFNFKTVLVNGVLEIYDTDLALKTRIPVFQNLHCTAVLNLVVRTRIKFST
jgi:hypothetical protein